jgi:hypothetical protein
MPISEDLPTIAMAPPVARPPELEATVAETRAPVQRPRSSMMDGGPPPASRTNVMTTLASPEPQPMDMATTRVMPMRPDSMGGFILRKGPGPSETPTVQTRNSPTRWTTIAVVVGVAVLVLWVLIVAVLRALFR